VRELYPFQYAYHGADQGQSGFALPEEPTSAGPGTPEKVAILQERMRRGVALWHPRDPCLVHERRRGPRLVHLALDESP
jgi:hypothetical protein